jgi:hypothetical protein
VGPPLPGLRRGASALQCAIPCWPPPTGVISATGRFVQDPSHPHDATDVLVSATVTTARRRPGRSLPCAPATGCPPAMVITSTVTLRDVTGHLRVPPPAGQRVTLSFLLPPVASTGVGRTALRCRAGAALRSCCRCPRRVRLGLRGPGMLGALTRRAVSSGRLAGRGCCISTIKTGRNYAGARGVASGRQQQPPP